MKTIILVLLILSITFCNAIRKHKPHNIGTTGEVVNTLDGPVKGLVDSVHRVFYGIPFAAPPVDTLRWTNPIDHPEWTEIKECFAIKPGCVQNCTLPTGACAQEISEDCLYLDVFTPPVSASPTLKPVFVFIPGGAFIMGGTAPLYDAKEMVSSADIVVVNVNYRLGALGFLATPELSGNFGFLDQVKALHWVKNNIQAFGGDPNRVTLGGQSAGAMSVAAHLVSPLSANLFHQVISMSTPLSLGFKTRANGEAMAAKFKTAAGCQTLECLRELNVEEILVAQAIAGEFNALKLLDSFTPFAPTIEPGVLDAQPMILFNTSQFNKVPMIIGDVIDEARPFIYAALQNNFPYLQYLGAAIQLFPVGYLKVMTEYPGNQSIGADNRPQVNRMVNDYLFACPTRNLTRLYVQNDLTVYTYRFKHVPSYTNPASVCGGHVCHGDDLPPLFQTFDQMGFQPTDEERDLGVDLNNYFTNFIANGDPNQGLPTPTTWDLYSENRQVLAINLESSMQTVDAENPACGIFDSITGYNKK